MRTYLVLNSIWQRCRSLWWHLSLNLDSNLWDISATLNNLFGLFATHSFTNFSLIYLGPGWIPFGKDAGCYDDIFNSWDLSATLKQFFGLFATHSFTNFSLIYLGPVESHLAKMQVVMMTSFFKRGLKLQDFMDCSLWIQLNAGL